MRNLQKFMTKHNMRHKDLAFMTGRTERAVHSWVAGDRPLPRSTLLLLEAFEEGLISEKWLVSKLAKYI